MYWILFTLLTLYSIAITKGFMSHRAIVAELRKSLETRARQAVDWADTRQKLENKLIAQQERGNIAENANFDNTETLLRLCFEYLVMIARNTADVIITQHKDQVALHNSRYYITILTKEGVEITKIKVSNDKPQAYPTITIGDLGNPYSCRQFVSVAENIVELIQEIKQKEPAPAR